MARDSLGDLLAFIAVARESSFTRAAAKLGVSQSSLSHTIRTLEVRLGVRLLTRTTRSVALTDAGQRVLESIAPRLQAIESELAAVTELGAQISGAVRITAIDYAVETVLMPRLAPLAREHPGIRFEISADDRVADLATDGFDIGVRWGDQVAKDMVAVRLAPDMQQTIVAAPAYLERRGVPQEPRDLLQHDCITLRQASSGTICAWRLQKRARALEVQVSGQTTVGGAYQMLNAALSGNGLAFMPEDLVRPHVQAGRLRSVMADWCPVFPGLHAYHLARQPLPRVLALVVDAIRWRN